MDLEMGDRDTSLDGNDLDMLLIRSGADVVRGRVSLCARVVVRAEERQLFHGRKVSLVLSSLRRSDCDEPIAEGLFGNPNLGMRSCPATGELQLNSLTFISGIRLSAHTGLDPPAPALAQTPDVTFAVGYR